MIEITLIRHGEPEWIPGGRAVDDPGLTPLGHAQAEATARFFAGGRFDSFYCSRLRRSQESARPLAGSIGMEPEVESWLVELGLPALKGKTHAEVRQFFAGVMERDLEQWWDGVPGGESFRHFYERVSSGIEGMLTGSHRLRIHEEHSHRLWRLPDEDRRILITAHEGSNGVIVAHLLGIDPVPWASMRFPSNFCGITRLHTRPIASGHVFVLESFNRIGHLDELTSRGV